MRYARLFARAWKAARRSKRLVWLALVPSIAQVSFLAGQVSWQVYRYGGEFGFLNERHDLAGILDLFRSISEQNLVGWTIGFVALVFLFSFLLNPLVDGTVLLSVHQRLTAPKKKQSLRQKIIEASSSFFELFELNALLRTFSVWGVIMWSFSFYRYFHEGLWPAVRPFMIFWGILAVVVTVLSAYSRLFVLIEREGFRKSIRRSTNLTFLFFGQTAAVALLMFLVNIRIVLNVVVVLGIPLGAMALTAWWASSAVWTVGVITGIAVMLLVAYLNAIVDVFSSAVWAQTFRLLRARQDEMNEESPTPA